MAIGTPLPRRDRRRSSILRLSGIGTDGTVRFVSWRATGHDDIFGHLVPAGVLNSTQALSSPAVAAGDNPDQL
ncbi:hypothetical protein N7509_004502 [Penicillium cosmopolitanum]|uniref:Uncharacterized protein n=1 Tax=Penicillium cosmopolitanum TaxID=1131564 RepID=A0A9W9W0E4_9EURO|nr:uncharacterized protein N7509_004502 [Penicillium cosmopolitanum]KAJ5396389.1 hypothetical protein N7509_004502 [Penicillium cosmopolitanum]